MEMEFIVIGTIIFLLILAGAVFYIKSPARKIAKEMYRKTGKHPKGHYINLGIMYGLLFGMALSVVFDEVSLGPAMGLPIGLAIGAALEKKYADRLRPLTKEEEKAKEQATKFAIAALVLGVIVFAALFFLA